MHTNLCRRGPHLGLTSGAPRPEVQGLVHDVVEGILASQELSLSLPPFFHAEPRTVNVALPL